MTNYIGFLPLNNITDQALQTVALHAKSLQAHIVCRHEDIAIIDRLYLLLGEEHPGYINTSIDAEDSDMRVAQSCDILFIYWDGKDRRNRRASEIQERPDQSFILLPGGTTIHMHEQYKDIELSANALEEWIYRPESALATITDSRLEEWNGLFTGKYFFLSSLSSLPTYVEDTSLYPSLLHALIGLAILEPVWVEFFKSSRFSYPTDIDGWLKDFDIDINKDILDSESIIGTLLYNRFQYNSDIFANHPFDIEQIKYHQSYPLDQIIARILKDAEVVQEGKGIDEDGVISNVSPLAESSLFYTQGDMFDNEDNGILFIPVNCKGAMGAGLALDAAERYPEVQEVYKKACRDGSLVIGKPLLTSSRDGKILLLFPTKDHWRNRSELAYIESGIRYFNEQLLTNDIGCMPLHIPMLGCGLGGLDWGDVNPIIDRYFHAYPSKVYVYL